MILLGEYEELAPGMGFPSMRDFLQDAPYEHQSAIVDYLNSGHIHMVTATRFTDVFTGKRVNRELVYMDDGVYSWSSKLPYYVAKYNLRLPAEFEAHVLSQTLKSKFFKNNPTDKIWWVDTSDRVGEFVFTFDKKTFFNMFADYPHKLSPEQKEIFDKENPFWKDFFSDRE